MVSITTRQAIAQEYSGCFMVHPSGLLEDLSRMCAVPVIPAVQSSTPASSPIPPSRSTVSSFMRSTRVNLSMPRPTVLQPADNPFVSGRRRYSTRNDDGICTYASDRARDGSRCGRRASQIRPGGR
ncbi:hypothetical protein [Leptolyngbya sp. O-77]|uniref:hypothetical protein n=1 Tax=Leptolyngbya sp. O-77 TaxID=1080068 RepID=UPI0012E3C917|nr:hypothetical protein [Leptolyngbya sp. O-77]